MSCYRNTCDKPASLIIDWYRYGEKKKGRADRASWDKVCAGHGQVSRVWGTLSVYP